MIQADVAHIFFQNGLVKNLRGFPENKTPHRHPKARDMTTLGRDFLRISPRIVFFWRSDGAKRLNHWMVLLFFENGRKMMAVGFWLYLNLVSGVLMLLQSMLRHLLTEIILVKSFWVVFFLQCFLGRKDLKSTSLEDLGLHSRPPLHAKCKYSWHELQSPCILARRCYRNEGLMGWFISRWFFPTSRWVLTGKLTYIFWLLKWVYKLWLLQFLNLSLAWWNSDKFWFTPSISRVSATLPPPNWGLPAEILGPDNQVKSFKTCSSPWN